MSPLKTILEFTENTCRVYVWDIGKGANTLKTALRVPFERPRETGEETKDIIQTNAAALRATLKNAGLKIKDALAVVPKQWVNLRVVTLPTSELSEVAEMARFEAERYIPFNVERHIISHHVLRVEGLEGTRVVLAALDGPLADEITGIADALGIRLTGLDVTTLALANALFHSGQWDSEANPTVAQIDIGYSNTDITIFNKGIPIFARSISLGIDRLIPAPPSGTIQDISTEEIAAFDLLQSLAINGDEFTPDPAAQASAVLPTRDWSRRLVQEVRRTYEFAQREFDCEPMAQIFVSGAGAPMHGLHQVLLTNLGIEPMELHLFNSELKIDTAGPGLAQAAPHSLVLAAGALFRDMNPKALALNLLPLPYVSRHSVSERKRALIIRGSLVALLLIMAFTYAHSVIADRADRLAYYNDQLKEILDQSKELEYRRTVVRILKANTSKQGSALAILDTISSWADLFSDSNMRISISEFTYEAQKSVRLEGEANSLEDLNEFRTRLEKTEHFRRVTVQSQSPNPSTQVPGRTVYRYSLLCPLAFQKAVKAN